MLAEFQEISELNVFLNEGFRGCWRLASDDEFSELSILMGDWIKISRSSPFSHTVISKESPLQWILSLFSLLSFSVYLSVFCLPLLAQTEKNLEDWPSVSLSLSLSLASRCELRTDYTGTRNFCMIFVSVCLSSFSRFTRNSSPMISMWLAKWVLLIFTNASIFTVSWNTYLLYFVSDILFLFHLYHSFVFMYVVLYMYKYYDCLFDEVLLINKTIRSDNQI